MMTFIAVVKEAKELPLVVKLVLYLVLICRPLCTDVKPRATH